MVYLKEFENVEVILKHYTQPSKWEKNLGFKPKLNESFLIHWALLKTKSEYRKKFIKVKCDDCGKIIERRIRDLSPNKNYHLCIKCGKSGNRNGMYGKQQSEKQKISLMLSADNYGDHRIKNNADDTQQTSTNELYDESKRACEIIDMIIIDDIAEKNQFKKNQNYKLHNI